MYTVQGTKLFDGTREFQIHGQNTTGFETKDVVCHSLWDGVTIKDYIAGIKSEGFNTLRIPVGTLTLQNLPVNPDHTACDWLPGNAFLKGKKSLEILDIFIAECETQNMRYIIDNHYIEDGHLQPLWYTARYPESQWLADISTFALRYKGNKGFVGIDICNEPDKGGGCTWGSGNAATDFKIAAEKAHAAIAKVNPDILTIVEWIQTSFSDQIRFPLAIPDSKLLISCHVYGASVWGPYSNAFNDPSYPNNFPQIWDEMFGNYMRSHAVYFGEVGGKYVDKDKQWHDKFIPYLLALNPNPHLTWWCWADDSFDTGGILLPGSKSKNQDKLNMLKPLRTSLATYTETTMPKPTPDPVNPVNPVTPGTFAVGNIVELISGSPRMVVSGVPATGGNVEVTYYNQVSGTIVGGKYPAAVLKVSTALRVEEDFERIGARARLIAEGKITSDHVKPSAVSPGRRVSIIPTPEVDAGE